MIIQYCKHFISIALAYSALWMEQKLSKKVQLKLHTHAACLSLTFYILSRNCTMPKSVYPWTSEDIDELLQPFSLVGVICVYCRKTRVHRSLVQTKYDSDQTWGDAQAEKWLWSDRVIHRLKNDSDQIAGMHRLKNYSDQTGEMHTLLRIFAGSKWNKEGFLAQWLKWYSL